VKHDGMPYDLIKGQSQGQGHGGPKLVLARKTVNL